MAFSSSSRLTRAPTALGRPGATPSPMKDRNVRPGWTRLALATPTC